ncbi:MAG TPA: carbohydrate kinase family protein [Spirochaetota bacterium]
MKYDVYAYGMISSSMLHVLQGKYPEADCYAEIKESFRMVGGEAANSSIVLRKLGVGVKLDGNWLGENPDGHFTKEILDSYGIDTSRLTLKKDYTGVSEIVFADGLTRTNFGTYVRLLFTEKQWNIPSREDIESARIVCLDPFFKDESAHVARICREVNKPYVSIDAHPEDDISRYADVMIISGEFRHREYKGTNKEELFDRYIAQSRGLVILTSGGDEILYGRAGQGMKKASAYKITPIDTAGGGDSFRSGILYGMLQGWSDEQTITFASALAACVCLSFPGVLNSPEFGEVDRFMREHG